MKGKDRSLTLKRIFTIQVRSVLSNHDNSHGTEDRRKGVEVKGLAGVGVRRYFQDEAVC